jgi:hypothetical protein
MTSVPTPPQGLVFTSVSTSYHRLASEKASSRTLQAYFARLSCTHLSSRLVSDQVIFLRLIRLALPAPLGTVADTSQDTSEHEGD